MLTALRKEPDLRYRSVVDLPADLRRHLKQPADPGAPTQLLAAVDRASKALRRRIGESPAELRDVPGLEQVTAPT